MTFRDWLANLLEGVLIALDAIRSNKVRAGLTILGIAVGVFVVTVMSAAVHGINEGVSKSIAAAGPTTFFLTRWPAEITSCNGSADSCPWRRNPPLTLAQGKEIEKLPFIHGVTAHIGSSASRNKVFIKTLSIPHDDASTPHPTYGTSAISISP